MELVSETRGGCMHVASGPTSATKVHCWSKLISQ